MASRKEQKERLRQERLAAEEAAREAAARARRLRMAGAAGLALVAVAAVAIAVAAGGGGGSGPKANSAALRGVVLPAPKTTDLATAARQAGCRLQSFPRSYEDRNHTTGKVAYKTNPPAFGPHAPVPASDGDYIGQPTPPKEQLVHALEHGRVEIQYRSGLPVAQRRQLEKLFEENVGSFGPGQYLLLFENQTRMPYAVAATAWTQILGCRTFTPRVFDALRDFRQKYTLKGPEQITQAE